MLCSLGMVVLTPSPSVFYDSFIWVFSALHLSMSLSSLPAVCHACRTFLRSFTFSHCPVVHPVSHQPFLTLMRLTGHGVALGVNCPSCFHEPSFGEARHMVLQCSFIGVRFSSICSLISSLVFACLHVRPCGGIANLASTLDLHHAFGRRSIEFVDVSFPAYVV